VATISRKGRRRRRQAARQRARRRARAARQRLSDTVQRLPSIGRELVDAFAPVFSRATLHRFVVLMLAVILTTGNRTIMGLLRTVGGLAPGHSSSYHRVFSRRRWSSFNLARVLAGLILTYLVPEGRVELAGDDTVDGHRGAKVYGKGCHRDAVRSSHTFTAFRWGHKWVVLSILVRLPFASRPWALPVLVTLYLPAKKEKKQGKARAEKKAKGKKARKKKPKAPRRHKTPALLMRQMLAVLMRWFPDRQFSFAGDGGFGTHELSRFVSRHQSRLRMISRFYANASLYMPPPPISGKRPSHRPRKKGDKLPCPEMVVRQTTQFTRANVAWYGGGRRHVEIAYGTGHWFKSGHALVPVLWVFVRDCTGTHSDDYFFSTDVTMKPTELIEAFTGRWSIETTFQEMRAHLGLETTRGRSEKTVLRMAPCLFGMYSVVVLIYSQLPARTRRVQAIAWSGKKDTTFSDAITTVRRWLWREWVFQVLGFDETFTRLARPFQELLLSAVTPTA
jgi:hypothetical protein